jgi:hypothetical protein
MRRRIALLAVVSVSCLIVLLLLWVSGQFSQSPAPTLPDASEIESISAEVFDPQHVKAAVPNFIVHSQYYEVILRALRPAERYEYPNSIHFDSQALGAFTIKAKSGTTRTVKYVSWGHNPTVYLLDGVVCIRTGEFNSMFGSKDIGWLDEGDILRQIVSQIIQSQKTGKESDQLRSLIQNMEHSRGELPPRH